MSVSDSTREEIREKLGDKYPEGSEWTHVEQNKDEVGLYNEYKRIDTVNGRRVRLYNV